MASDGFDAERNSVDRNADAHVALSGRIFRIGRRLENDSSSPSIVASKEPAAG
jgi:hypothetical protein